MNSHQYFCNLYQAYLMATNSSEISYVTLERYEGNILYYVPGNHELTLYYNAKIRGIRIKTNYKKPYPYDLQGKYYYTSEIEALSYDKRYYSPLYSIVKASEDGKTLLITRRVLL